MIVEKTEKSVAGVALNVLCAITLWLHATVLSIDIVLGWFGRSFLGDAYTTKGSTLLLLMIGARYCWQERRKW